jgi:hypothetical protein
MVSALDVLIEYFLERLARICFGGAKVFSFASPDHLVPNGHAHRSLLTAG